MIRGTLVLGHPPLTHHSSILYPTRDLLIFFHMAQHLLLLVASVALVHLAAAGDNERDRLG